MRLGKIHVINCVILICISCAFTWVNTRLLGGSYNPWRGFPFQFEVWNELTGPPFVQFRWHWLGVNIILCVIVLTLIGISIERFFLRFHKSTHDLASQN